MNKTELVKVASTFVKEALELTDKQAAELSVFHTDKKEAAEKAAHLVDHLIRLGHLTPSQKKEATDLCSTAAGACDLMGNIIEQLVDPATAKTASAGNSLGEGAGPESQGSALSAAEQRMLEYAIG